MQLTIQPTDKRFTDSPDTGDAQCLCSRCGQKIEQWQTAIRAWPEKGDYEYRFHTFCIGLGPDRTKEEWETEQRMYEEDFEYDFGIDPQLTDPQLIDQKCRVCGCQNQMACFDDAHGACWWIDAAATNEGPICSHCHYNYPNTSRPWQKEVDKSYELVSKDDQSAIKCLHCGSSSFNPNDIKHKYCVVCDLFHQD